MNAKELLEKIEFYKKSIEEDKAYLDELEQDDEDDVYEYACDELRNDELLLRKHNMNTRIEMI